MFNARDDYPLRYAKTAFVPGSENKIDVDRNELSTCGECGATKIRERERERKQAKALLCIPRKLPTELSQPS